MREPHIGHPYGTTNTLDARTEMGTKPECRQAVIDVLCNQLIERQERIKELEENLEQMTLSQDALCEYIARLEAVLKPFADRAGFVERTVPGIVKDLTPVSVLMGMLRAAREVLKGAKK